MADVRKKIIGTLKGKLGDVVFRERNGKIIAYSKPKKYRKTKSVKLKKERNKFATVVQLANIIKSIPDLYFIWKNSDLPGSNAYQRIIKNNLQLTNGADLTINNLLFPPGIDLNISLVEINQTRNKISEINIEIDFDNYSKEIFQESTLIGVLYKTNNSKGISAQEKFYIIQTDTQINSDSQKINLKIPVNLKLTNGDSILGLFGLISKNKNFDTFWTSSKGFKLN
ncbi:MAG: hypothetical protein NUV92_09775 [Ignavibacteria bacterium]|jgi:hypothetical protein|nr:hypothetical protein [Ignavibacteria bacterium]MDH7528214.1 hypothetical protein [Ignavibacteria bacterium]